MGGTSGIPKRIHELRQEDISSKQKNIADLKYDSVVAFHKICEALGLSTEEGQEANKLFRQVLNEISKLNAPNDSLSKERINDSLSKERIKDIAQNVSKLGLELGVNDGGFYLTDSVTLKKRDSNTTPNYPRFTTTEARKFILYTKNRFDNKSDPKNKNFFDKVDDELINKQFRDFRPLENHNVGNSSLTGCSKDSKDTLNTSIVKYFPEQRIEDKLVYAPVTPFDIIATLNKTTSEETKSSSQYKETITKLENLNFDGDLIINTTSLLRNLVFSNALFQAPEVKNTIIDWVKIDLQNHKIGNEEVKQLAQALDYKSNLQELSLSANQIGDEGAIALAENLKKHNLQLKALNLSGNQIGDEGVAALTKNLQHQRLKILGLSNNQIGDEGAVALANYLKEHPALRILNLHINQIGDEGAVALANSLKENPELNKFKLSMFCNRVNNHSVETIKEIFQDNSRIELDLSRQKPKTIVFPTEKNSNSYNQDILNLHDLIKEGSNLGQHKSEKAILILGKTRSGKSTLANLFLGRKLKATEDEETGDLVINTVDSTNIAINHGRTSETRVPNRAQIGNTVIWDCPGFKDTDAAQEIANAFYIRELCKSSDKVKFILVVSDSELTNNRSTPFLETLEQMVKTFDDIDDIKDSVSLVVTGSRSRKDSEKIINTLDRILTQRDNLDSNIKNMLEYLKQSVHVFHSPVDEGILKTQTPLPSIEKSTKYYSGDNKIVNLSLSDKAIEYASTMLNTANNNFNEGVGAIKKAVENPAKCLNPYNAFTKKHHQLVKKWIPSSMNYSHNSFKSTTCDGNFLHLDVFRKMDDILNVPVSSHYQGVKKLIRVIEIFEHFVRKGKGSDHNKILQDYTYFFKQQLSYVQFFSDLTKEDLPEINKFNKIFDQLHIVNLKNFKQALIKMEIEPNQDKSYYEKVEKYLNMHKEPECITKKAECYIKLGDLHQANDQVKESIDYFYKAIESDEKIPGAYRKLGDLLYKQEDYNKAIHFYSKINNFSKIENSFKSLIQKYGETTFVRMQMGDFYKAFKLDAKARKNYLKAFSLIEDFSSEESQKHLSKLEGALGLSISQESDWFSFDQAESGFASDIFNLPQNANDAIPVIDSICMENNFSDTE